ncbi:protein MLP1 homolog [Panicum virgatum]|uniref:CCHC-type domain-containing protein n=1 Tax=Panicum virgatum TaxID=38727 RepID=A0A8T0NL88_PANVG|nr:protein MLP1 homolog [Panicum virgatum]KAG2547624.1 hypothetical protein PVAP13_9KG470385 [Panicum virgatum]
MDSRNGNAAAAAAAAPLPQHPLHALLALPDLDRPPAVLETWELEAVAAALPAKKRRLRETFDRLAACAPAPLPFRWEDLDTYISSLQYSGTLRRRQLRELDESRPAPAALAPAPAPVSATGDGVSQVARPVHAPRPISSAISEPAATGADARKLRALEVEEPEPANAPDPAPAPPAVPATAATAVDAEKGKKRKTSSHEADAIHAEIRVQEEGQAGMPKIHEGGAAAASPLEGLNRNGKKSRPVPDAGPADSNGLAAEPSATARVDPVGKIAVVSQELPGPAAARHAPNATNRAGRLPLQRMSRPPRPIPASAAAPVTGGQEVEAANQKKDDLVVVKNASHDGGAADASSCHAGLGSGDGLPRLGADPISQITGVRHEPPASNAASPPKGVASFPLAMVPKQEQQAVEEEVPDVEMEMEIAVEPDEMQALNDDAPVADEKASPLHVKAEEADEVSRCSRGGHRDAGATVRESSPAATPDAPNLVEAGAPKSAGEGAATRDAARLAPAGSGDDASTVSPVPPRRGSGLAPSGSGVSADDDAMRTVAAGKSAAAVARRDSPAATRHDLGPATGREAAGPPQASRAPPKASNKQHVLQKQHMPKQGYHPDPSYSAHKQNEHHSFSRNHGHGGRPAGFRPVPEAQAAAARWNGPPPGEWRGGGGRGGSAAAGGLQEDGSRSKGGNAKGKPPKFKFCNKCGCRGHLAENCRTAKHLVDLYQRAKEEEKNQICYRCGCTGHWSRKCRTPKHLVDLYQKDRAAKRAAARGDASS